MKRGFYTGLAALLVFFVLANAWHLYASFSDREVADLLQLQALRVSEHAQDAKSFFSSSIVDAEQDAAFFVHGCAPFGSYCSAALSRVFDYVNASALRLSSSGIVVRPSLVGWICSQTQAPSGFSEAYQVNVSFLVRLQSGPVDAIRWVNQSDLVWVNSSASFRSQVNSSGPAGTWVVGVEC